MKKKRCNCPNSLIDKEKVIRLRRMAFSLWLPLLTGNAAIFQL
ncbi:MAG: hypothetical protein ACK5RQ_12630 [Bacteroidota bacterium]